MKIRKLQNYLKLYRKRSHLSQRELSYLLGCESRLKVLRYEQDERIPQLPSLLAYEVIFQIPICELFSGICKEVHKEIKKRAEILIEKVASQPPSTTLKQKIAFLQNLSSSKYEN